jgi:RNA polymerase sigma-70 factor (ECF subfamily)
MPARTIERAQAGDSEAGDQLARHCQRQAYLFALQLTGNPDDALDVTQEALLRLFGTLARVDPERPIRPYLLRIVRNLVWDRLRKRRVRKTRSLEDEGRELVLDPPDPALGPEELAARHELQRILWAQLSSLPARQREVVALRDYMGLSYAEISRALRIPVGTVMSRLHRGRARLRTAVLARTTAGLGAGRKEADHG